MRYLIGLFRVILSPFSLLLSMIIGIRRFLYNVSIKQQYVYDVPVISIGNINLGGTGKTPMVIWLLEYFASKRIAVLTRGYRSKKEHDRAIIKETTVAGLDPDEFGDEPLLLSRKITKGSIIIGKNRVANLNFYYNEIDPELVLLDDGFQYLKIYRDLDIVMIDATRPIESFRMFPCGNLRDSLSTLRNADVVVLNKVTLDEKFNRFLSFIENYVSGIMVKTYYKLTGLVDANFILAHPPEYVSGKNVVLMAAIAEREALKNQIESLGGNIVEKFYFSDHFSYQQKNVNKVLKVAQKENAIIITTEKDLIKIRKWVRDSIVLALSIDIEFVEGKESFIKKLNEIVR
jgi:tetraacyldisaccharide 4'-kinase